MTERKFTDEEVIKALEHCTSSTTSEACNGCPFYDTDVCIEMDNALNIYALDLINRQRAKLKALKMDNDQLQSDIVNATMNLESVQHELDKAREEIESLTQNNISTKYPNRVLCSLGVIFTKSLEDYDKLIGDISAEAIKEFAKRLELKAFLPIGTYFAERIVTVNDIVSIAKEMTEENNEKKKDNTRRA